MNPVHVLSSHHLEVKPRNHPLRHLDSSHIERPLVESVRNVVHVNLLLVWVMDRCDNSAETLVKWELLPSQYTLQHFKQVPEGTGGREEVHGKRGYARSHDGNDDLAEHLDGLLDEHSYSMDSGSSCIHASNAVYGISNVCAIRVRPTSHWDVLYCGCERPRCSTSTILSGMTLIHATITRLVCPVARQVELQDHGVVSDPVYGAAAVAMGFANTFFYSLKTRFEAIASDRRAADACCHDSGDDGSGD